LTSFISSNIIKIQNWTKEDAGDSLFNEQEPNTKIQKKKIIRLKVPNAEI